MDVLLVCLSSFERVLVGQKQLIKINNDKIRIELGANPFLLL